MEGEPIRRDPRLRTQYLAIKSGRVALPCPSLSRPFAAMSSNTNEHGDLESLPSSSPRFTFGDFLRMWVMLVKDYNSESYILVLCNCD